MDGGVAHDKNLYNKLPHKLHLKIGNYIKVMIINFYKNYYLHLGLRYSILGAQTTAGGWGIRCLATCTKNNNQDELVIQDEYSYWFGEKNK